MLLPVVGLRLTDIKEIDGVVVTRKVGVIVIKVGALPSLGDGAVVEGVRLVRPNTLHKSRCILLIVVEHGVYDIVLTFMGG